MTTAISTMPRVVATPVAEEPGTPLLELRAAVRDAVDRIDLAIHPREAVGVVGEARCGKSTLARLAVGLLPLASGQRRWRGQDITHLRGRAARAVQLSIQMLFPDPDTALNPHMRVLDIVGEAPVAHKIIQPRQQVEYVGLQLNRVGMDPMLMRAYPHQLTPAQCARIGIARALAVQPRLLVCDEAVTMLDASVQAQLLNLLMDLRTPHELAQLFLSRDVSVVTHISDRVLVMYGGRIVESAATAQLLAAPAHPYTQALLAPRRSVQHGPPAIAIVHRDAASSALRSSGCPFHPRCPHAMDACRTVVPPLLEVATGHLAACHLHTPA